jgi:rod shape-determining protein MreC
MRYQHLKTTRKLHKYLAPIIPVCIALLLLVTKAQVPSFLSSTTHAVAVPFWTLKNAITTSSGNVFNSFKSKKNLLLENKALYEETLRLQREAFVLKAYRNENIRLHSILARTNEQSNILTASIIHNDSFSPYDTFIIDLGSNDGIRNDMLVLTPEGIAVGTITNTLKNSSVVTQFSAPKISLDIFLNATTSFHTTLLGQGSGTMLMTVPRDILLSIDDMVLLPNFSTYPVGRVSFIEVAPEDAYKKVYVRSPVNTYELRHVLVNATAVWKIPAEESVPELEVTPEELQP